MLKTIRISCITLLAALAASAQAAPACPPALEAPSQEVLQRAMQNASDHGYLWRISKDGHTSYLYGTMHVGKPEWVFPGPTIVAALRATDTVALELDMLDPEVMERLKKALAAAHGNPLPEPLAKRLQHEAEIQCVPYDKLAGIAPEMQVAVLGVASSRWDGLDAAYAIDAMLAGLGHGAQKNMVSLETPEFQIQSLMMKTPQETADFVQYSLDDMDNNHARTELKRLSEAWARSDYAEMEHFQEWCDCMKTEIEKVLMKRLLDERNPAMAEHIDALHRKGKQVFVAVGSMHMFGPIGLPALMEKRGYKVERIELNAGKK